MSDSIDDRDHDTDAEWESQYSGNLIGSFYFVTIQRTSYGNGNFRKGPHYQED